MARGLLRDFRRFWARLSFLKTSPRRPAHRGKETTMPAPSSTGNSGRSLGTMTTAVLYAPRDLRIEQRPVPTPSEGEVLVRILSVGVCGSDVHYYEHGRIADFVVV